MAGLAEYLAPANDALLEERNQRRAAMTERLVKQSAQHGLRPGMDLAAAVRGAKQSQLWSDFAEDCVECGACNFICPTCHCFLLVDVEERGKFKRFKNWDSCLYPAFARVAGGANPRARRVERRQNRFEKKFDFLISTLGLWGCTGCGRCTEACAGDIDVREVLKDILLS